MHVTNHACAWIYVLAMADKGTAKRFCRDYVSMYVPQKAVFQYVN